MSDLNQTRNASLRKSWKLDEGTRSEIAGVMNTWSSGRGSGRFEELGSMAEIVEVSEWGFFELSQGIQHENRTIHPRIVPGKGPPPLETSVRDPKEVDLWELTLPPVLPWKKERGSMEVPGSRAMKGCAPCDGAGESRCGSCDGKGKERCGSCGGKGQGTCSACRGHGKTTCGDCGGRGEYTKDKICPKCGGLGTYRTQGPYGIIETPCPTSVTVRYNCKSCRYGKVTCRRCGGNGRQSCPPCAGSGVIVCKPCSGKGKITCSSCKGSGRLLHYLELIREVTVEDFKDVCCSSPSIKRLFLDHRERADQGRELLKLEDTAALAAIDDLTGELGHWVGKKLEESIGACKGRIKRHRCSLICHRLVEVTYKVADRSYQFVFNRDTGEVYPTRNPMRDDAGTALTRARELYTERRFDDAWTAFHEAEGLDDGDVNAELLQGQSLLIRRFLYLEAAAFRAGILLLAVPCLSLIHTIIAGRNPMLHWFAWPNIHQARVRAWHSASGEHILATWVVFLLALIVLVMRDAFYQRVSGAANMERLVPTLRLGLFRGSLASLVALLVALAAAFLGLTVPLAILLDLLS